MRYRFTDTINAPRVEFGFVTQYGATVLDEIEGVTTLTVAGRGNVAREFSTLSNIHSARDFTIADRYKPVNLEVKLKLEAKDDYAMRDLVDKLNLIFVDHPQKLKFSDDAYYYIASLESMRFDETANQTTAVLRFRSDYPFRFLDVEGKGNIFKWRTYLPVVPDEIICEAQASATAFSLVNSRSGQSIRLSRAISAGQVIRIEPSKHFGITVNGQNAMASLVPSSEFERFELDFTDELVCTPSSRISMKARIVKLG